MPWGGVALLPRRRRLRYPRSRANKTRPSGLRLINGNAMTWRCCLIRVENLSGSNSSCLFLVFFCSLKKDPMVDKFITNIHACFGRQSFVQLLSYNCHRRTPLLAALISPEESWGDHCVLPWKKAIEWNMVWYMGWRFSTFCAKSTAKQ